LRKSQLMEKKLTKGDNDCFNHNESEFYHNVQVLCDCDPSKGSIYTVAGKGSPLKRLHTKYLKVMLNRGMVI